MKLSPTQKRWLALAILLLGVVWVSNWGKHREPEHQGKTAKEWTKDLKVTQLGETNAALNALLEIGPQSIPTLRRMLTEGDGPLDRGLTKFRDKLPENLRKLIEAPTPQNTRHAYAAWALGQIGPAARDAVPDLVHALDSPDAGVRLYAVNSLKSIDVRTPEVIAALIKRAEDQDQNVGNAAVFNLRWMAPQSAPAIPVFQRLLADTSRAPLAASALGALGPASSNAIPALIRLMNQGTNLTSGDQSPRAIYQQHQLAIRSMAAAVALGNIGLPSDEVMAALHAVSVTDSAVKTNALASLQKLTLNGIPPLVDQILKTDLADETTLMPLLEKLDADGRARFYLMKHPDVARQLAPLVARRLIDPQPHRYVAATQLLQALQPDHPSILPMIQKAMRDEFIPNRLDGVVMYWKATGDPQPALKLITTCMESTDPEYTRFSQGYPQWLARMGPAAKPAVPALIKALWGPDKYSRQQAAKALQEIDPEALEKALASPP